MTDDLAAIVRQHLTGRPPLEIVGTPIQSPDDLRTIAVRTDAVRVALALNSPQLEAELQRQLGG